MAILDVKNMSAHPAYESGDFEKHQKSFSAYTYNMYLCKNSI